MSLVPLSILQAAACYKCEKKQLYARSDWLLLWCIAALDAVLKKCWRELIQWSFSHKDFLRQL